MNASWPESIQNVDELEELLSRPDEQVVDLFRRMSGPLAILGAGGKIGPSLAKMACRARELAGGSQDIFVVSRFSNPQARRQLEQIGAKAIACDLMDPSAVAALPEASDVIYMVGQKFGTRDNPSLTWAVNTLAPAYAASRYKDARIVAYSTGCVYDFAPVESRGSVETDPLTPIGEYSNSCVARERVLEYVSRQFGTAMVLVRLNYAVEMRYGVLVDLALGIQAGRCVNLGMGYFNVIWQGDANAFVLRMLDHAANPAKPMNLTGPEKLSVRSTAVRLAELLGKSVQFQGVEAATALLSDASATHRQMGTPQVPAERVIRWVAQWVKAGGEILGKPTHFETFDGKY